MTSRALVVFILSSFVALTGCQWGSGNVQTGPVTVVKVFNGCPEAESGVQLASDGESESDLSGAASVPSADIAAAARFTGSLGGTDRCEADATLDPQDAGD